MYLQTRHTHTHTTEFLFFYFCWWLCFFFHFKVQPTITLLTKKLLSLCRLFQSHSTPLSCCNVSFEARKMSRVLHGWVRKRFNVNIFNSLMMHSIYTHRKYHVEGNKKLRCLLHQTYIQINIFSRKIFNKDGNKPPLIVWQLFIINRFFIGNSNIENIIITIWKKKKRVFITGRRREALCKIVPVLLQNTWPQ